jgi:Leucine-rich repeat (LRR) protein
MLRNCDLLGSRIHSLEPFRTSSNLLHLNIRYTKVKDLSPVANLANLKFLDAGCTEVEDCKVLAGMENLLTLYLDDTEVNSAEEVIDGCANLSSLNVGFTNVPKSLKPRISKMCKAASRSYMFFILVMEQNKASTFDKLTKLVEEGYEIDQRCHYKFHGDDGEDVCGGGRGGGGARGGG